MELLLRRLLVFYRKDARLESAVDSCGYLLMGDNLKTGRASSRCDERLFAHRYKCLDAREPRIIGTKMREFLMVVARGGKAVSHGMHEVGAAKAPPVFGEVV
jgi:hypothetical protein